MSDETKVQSKLINELNIKFKCISSLEQGKLKVALSKEIFEKINED